MVCVPVLMYGIDGISISKTNVKRLDSTQGNLVKQSMGLSKRSHTSELFAALGINRYQEIVNHNLISLYHRIFNVNTPYLISPITSYRCICICIYLYILCIINHILSSLVKTGISILYNLLYIMNMLWNRILMNICWSIS